MALRFEDMFDRNLEPDLQFGFAPFLGVPFKSERSMQSDCLQCPCLPQGDLRLPLKQVSFPKKPIGIPSKFGRIEAVHGFVGLSLSFPPGAFRGDVRLEPKKRMPPKSFPLVNQKRIPSKKGYPQKKDTLKKRIPSKTTHWECMGASFVSLARIISMVVRLEHPANALSPRHSHAPSTNKVWPQLMSDIRTRNGLVSAVRRALLDQVCVWWGGAHFVTSCLLTINTFESALEAILGGCLSPSFLLSKACVRRTRE